MTTIVLALGVVLAYLFGPGHGMNIDPSRLDAGAMSNYAANAHKLQGAGVGSFIFNIIPSTSIDALSRNGVMRLAGRDIDQALAIAVLDGDESAESIYSEPSESTTHP